MSAIFNNLGSLHLGIGDALFFFISGYTLFLGKNDGFIILYKRRLARILQSVLVFSHILTL